MGLPGSPRGASLYRPPSVWRTWGTGSRCRISNGYELLCLVTPLV